MNAYEVNAGIGVIAGNTVRSMLERLECEVLQKARYTLIIIIIIIINDSIYPAVSKASRTGNKVSCQPNDCPNR